MASIDGSSRKPLIEDASFARYVRTGHIVFVRGSSLVAQGFDASRLELTGDPLILRNDVAVDPDTHAADVAAAVDTGALVTLRERAGLGTGFQWRRRAGEAEDVDVGRHVIRQVSLSASGAQVADAVDGLNRDIWTHDLARGVSTRITSDADEDETPVWSADGRLLAFSGDRDGKRHVFVVPVGSGDSPKSIYASARHIHLSSWSPDGRVLYGTQIDGTASTSDRNLISLDVANGHVVTLLDSPTDEYGPVVSPDGRWLAYVSEETGRPEVYLRPVGERARTPVSGNGGDEPMWSSAGGELFYKQGDTLMSVRFNPATGQTGRSS